MPVVWLGAFLQVLQLLRPSLATTEQLYSSFTVHENVAVLTNGEALKSEKTDSLMSCARICGRDPLCGFASFDEKQKSCLSVNESGADDAGKHWKKKEHSTGLGKVNYSQKGTRKESSVRNCKELLKGNPESTSGVYWIDPDAGSHDNAFKVYCDQVTEGGGWTLVWSYHFTDYQNFDKYKNAVTPRPNWEVEKSDVHVSTTPPLSEIQYDAMEFSLWKEIGSDVLIKSNINNWITCKPGNGSLVDWVEGSVTCHLVKAVNPKSKGCPGILPGHVRVDLYGPTFETSGAHYYYFDGYTYGRWPKHNPCGNDGPNQLTGVGNPHGNIFIR